MGEKLDFSLPEKKAGFSVAHVLSVLLLLVVVALAAMNLMMSMCSRKQAALEVGGLSSEQLKQLATKLGQRDLHQEAAAAWQDYMDSAQLDGPERAKVFFQIGLAQEKAGQYGPAIESYYRSELTAKSDELSSQIDPHIKQCFEKLGAFAALRYELMDRTSLNASEPAGGKVVAEIGTEKITEADLDGIIERSIENQLAPMAAYLSADQLNQQKKRMLERARDPKTKAELLQSWINAEVLYRQALEEGVAENPETRQMLEDVTRSVLSQELMNEKLASKINITEADEKTFYAANKDKYVEPAKATIGHILVADEEQAGKVLERIDAGEDFAALAKEFSIDEQTKADGGKIATPVVKGAPIPGIDQVDEINAAIFAAEAPSVLKRAFQTDKGWEIIKIESKTAERQKSFDDVRQQVMQELYSQKQQEIQQQYLEEMRTKHNVIIHTSALAPAEPDAVGGESATP